MTPGYAPYEQYSRKGNQGPHTDVYGCGATLYRMVTGQKPPPATDRVIEDTLQDPNEVNPDVPEGLSRAIIGALQMGDQERISNAQGLREQLQTPKAGLGNQPAENIRESVQNSVSARLTETEAHKATGKTENAGEKSRRGPANKAAEQPRKSRTGLGINYPKKKIFSTWNIIFLVTSVTVALGLGLSGIAPKWLPEAILLAGIGAELYYLEVISYPFFL
jgi:hypothetical protein